MLIRIINANITISLNNILNKLNYPFLISFLFSFIIKLNINGI